MVSRAFLPRTIPPTLPQIDLAGVRVQIPVNPTPICSWREWNSHLAHLIKSIGLQRRSLRKIPHVVFDWGSVVVTASLNIELGLQILYLCKIPQFVVQTGGGCSLEVKRGGLDQTLPQDGKERSWWCGWWRICWSRHRSTTTEDVENGRSFPRAV
jgi:hypothetical protein